MIVPRDAKRVMRDTKAGTDVSDIELDLLQIK
jgi:hypothetical protein